MIPRVGILAPSFLLSASTGGESTFTQPGDPVRQPQATGDASSGTGPSSTFSSDDTDRGVMCSDRLNRLVANDKSGESTFERMERAARDMKRNPPRRPSLGLRRILLEEGEPREKTRLHRKRSVPFGEISGMIHKGAARKQINADGLSFVEPRDKRAVYLIGADGAGSAVHAREAAKIVLNVLSGGILSDINVPDLFRIAHREVLPSQGASVAMVAELKPISKRASTLGLQVYWGGDYRGVLFRRYSGRYRPIYHTRDDSEVRKALESLPANHPAWKNPELWLMSQPYANKVFNAIGGKRPPRANTLEDGEFIDPRDSSVRWSARGTEAIPVRKGYVWLMASDGFWECFGHYDEVAGILDKGKGAVNLRRTFELEILRRMTLVERAEDPRAGGSISLRSGGRTWRLTSDGNILDSDGNIVGHFKIDNFSFFLHQS